jgi:leucyl-tRNA synthetase
VAEKELPVELPAVKSYEPTGTGESPLAGIKKWINVKIGKETFTRESNTMPQWAGSSWYYLRYMDPENKKALVDKEKEKYWNQVDLYVGGAEHATRHLIYARFWHKFLYDIGVVSTLEPFKRLQHVGLIMAEDGRKMSKRFGNVVNPDEIVGKYGADTMRIYEMFMGPFDQQIKWDTNSILGSRRFIERVWKLKEKVGIDTASKHIESILHKTIQKVSQDIEMMHFNTAISSLMIALNEFEKEMVIPKSVYESFIQLIAPFAPHITEEIWTKMGKKESIHLSEWPEYDIKKIVADSKTIVIQLNGKTKGTIQVDGEVSDAELEQKAKDFLKITEVKKVIVVPGKLVNIVSA